MGNYRPGGHQSSRPNSDTPHDGRTGTDGGATSNIGDQQLPVIGILHAPSRRDGPGIAIVDERNTVPDETTVLDHDPVANERMAADLAPGTNSRSGLDLDERPDRGFVTDPAAVQIHE
jgi:hypothetical protein